jgi:hypothetical protein
MDKEITKTRVADLTMDELRVFIRLEIARSHYVSPSQQPFKKFDIKKFPVVDLGEMLDDSDIRREDMYGDDGR